MADVDRPQRGQQYVDRDMMNIAMALGIPIGKSAELVGNVFYQRGERGVHTVTYGDLSSQVGEAYLRRFVTEILTTYASKFERELHALASHGEMVKPDDFPGARSQISDERLAEIQDRVRHAF